MKTVLFKDLKNNRITRTILGIPSSADITSYIDEDDTKTTIDYIDREPLTFKDVDRGVIYLQKEGMTKILNLKWMGYVGIKCESMYGPISSDNLIWDGEEDPNDNLKK